METFFLGEYIKQRRQDLRLSQEAVCDGICESITLSRIENGKQTPGRSRINAILERLGLPDDRYYALLSKNELEMEGLKKEIIACNSMHDTESGFQLIEKMEKIVNPDDTTERQFLLRSKILLGRLDGRYTVNEQITLLLLAIRMTVPRFDLDKIESFLYSREEIKIINQIAIAYSEAGDNKKALDIFYQLLRYVHGHLDETICSTGSLPLILYSYARTLDVSKRYQEAVKLAEDGIQACVKYGHYQHLPGCLAIAAESNYFLGEREKSAMLYHESYYLYKAIGNKAGLDAVKNDAFEYLGITFPY